MIDYRYLNMDTKKFCESESDLLTEVRYSPSSTTLMTIPASIKHNQILIAAGHNFTKGEAILLCKELSGL